MSYSTSAPHYQDDSAPDAINRLQPFTLIAKEQVRAAQDRTTPAWELTFRVPHWPLHDGLRAGMQIALLPINSDARVATALAALREVPATLEHRPAERDGSAFAPEPMKAETILAHTVDLTRPTSELLSLVDAPEGGNWSVEDFLAMHPGRISFAQLLANQPKLANRKYTPSDVNPETGTIRILLSEVHHHDYRGSCSGYLADLTPGDAVQGFFDIRPNKPIKLPYDYSKPMVLLSTGVGLGPHLAMLREAKRTGRTPEIAAMIAGGRFPADALCDGEIRMLLGAQEARYHYIASQTGAYVQDSLYEQHAQLWSAIARGAVIYVCGLESMKDHLRDTLEEIAAIHNAADPHGWVKSLPIFDSTSAPDRFYTKWAKKQAKALN